jgi:hypothetical protein
VIDIITADVGPPTGSYDDNVSRRYVWGAQLGTAPTVDQVKAAPFSIRTRPGLTCGDYAPNTVEFWVSGERIRP